MCLVFRILPEVEAIFPRYSGAPACVVPRFRLVSDGSYLNYVSIFFFQGRSTVHFLQAHSGVFILSLFMHSGCIEGCERSGAHNSNCVFFLTVFKPPRREILYLLPHHLAVIMAASWTTHQVTSPGVRFSPAFLSHRIFRHQFPIIIPALPHVFHVLPVWAAFLSMCSVSGRVPC